MLSHCSQIISYDLAIVFDFLIAEGTRHPLTSLFDDENFYYKLWQLPCFGRHVMPVFPKSKGGEDSFIYDSFLGIVSLG